MNEFETVLLIAQEPVFQQWKQRVAPNDSGDDYDFRGAFAAGVQPDENGHWPDRWKKPNHPTFSVESIWARDEYLARAGRWEGDRFIPPHSETPVAWKYELATGRLMPEETYCNWQAKLSFEKPNVPVGSIRNLVPLYSTSIAPASDENHPHLIGREFQSDKYQWCRRGFVPLKISDKTAQPFLWGYAGVRGAVDAKFETDLKQALNYAGYVDRDARP